MNDNTVKKEILYTADKFLEMTDLPERCELINGEIFDMSPSPNERHQDISEVVNYAMKDYVYKNKGKCRVYSAPFDVKLNEYTIVQPDLFIVCDRDKLDGKRCNGAPDWVIEIISPSSVDRDMREKLLLYSEAGVREYWIIDPIKERVFVYLFGKPNITGFYTFNDNIRVNIYKDSTPPLDICIARLLELLQ